MSDSGRQIGDCKHARPKESCEVCSPMAVENERLKAENRLHRLKAEGEYWAWQGDGGDHLESLVCPVLIRADDLRGLLAKLQAFKGYVHKRLDDAGIPVDPESPHRAEGCRIGGRLDVLIGRAASAPDLLAACQTMLPLLEHAERCEASADDGNGERLRKLRRQLQAARAAIAKATGATP